MAMVMTVGLTIGGDMDQLGVFSTRREGAYQAVGEHLAALEQALESDRSTDWPIVEEEVDRPA